MPTTDPAEQRRILRRTLERALRQHTATKPAAAPALAEAAWRIIGAALEQRDRRIEQLLAERAQPDPFRDAWRRYEARGDKVPVRLLAHRLGPQFWETARRDPRTSIPPYDPITGYRTWDDLEADPPQFTGNLSHHTTTADQQS